MPGALSSSNRAQLSWKLEGTYPTNFGVLQGGNGTKLNMLSESLDYAINTVSSKVIRSDRQVPDVVQTGASASGGISSELQYREYDPFILGVLQADLYTQYGTNGVSAAIATLTLASGSITAGAAPTGNDAFTTLNRSQWITIRPAAGASQTVKDYFAGRAFRIHATTAPTSTVITLDSATPINTAIAGASLTGATISSSRASNGNVMKSYSLQVAHEDIGQFRQYVGMVPSKMDLKLSVGDIVGISFDFMGKSMNLAQTTGMGTAADSQIFTPANATRGIFDIFEGGSSVTTSTYIKSMDLTIDNTLRMQDAVGVFGVAGIGAGTMQVTGKATMYFADAVMYQKFLSGSASSMSIPILDIDGNGYVLFFPRIKYTSAKVNVGGQDQDNELAMDFQALPDTTAGSATLGLTVLVYRVGA